MILQALAAYYERKKDSGELAPEGFEPKEIPFVLVLHADGTLAQIEDTRTLVGRTLRGRPFLVPLSVGKTSGFAANLLWETAENALCPDLRGRPERATKIHKAFVTRIDKLAEKCPDDGLATLRRFLASINLTRLSNEAAWEEIRQKNPVVSFRLIADRSDCLISLRPLVISAIQGREPDEPPESGLCLVTGEMDSLARTHPLIKGFRGAPPGGTKLVSFNFRATESFGKEQAYNAPVGMRAAFAYTTSLNHLLRPESTQRMPVGDLAVVFWTSEDSRFEEDFPWFFSTSKDDPDRGTHAIRNLFDAMRTGIYCAADQDAIFYVLGLQLNVARLSVAFWKKAYVKDVAPNICRHIDDIDIVKPPYSGPHLSLFRLLSSVAPLGKIENVAPNLAANVARAVLDGTPYPAPLLYAAVSRCRAEQAARDNKQQQQPNVPHARAAVIKASLNRLIRRRQLNAKEINVALDRDNKDVPYRLGRLFAVFERLQQDAHRSESGRSLNRTIRESYYGSASSSPIATFPVLVKLHHHHLSKLDKSQNPRRYYYRKLIGEIFGELPANIFPAHLSLQEQGLFAVGYYHQQQEFFAGKTNEGSALDGVTASIGDTTSGEHQ